MQLPYCSRVVYHPLAHIFIFIKNKREYIQSALSYTIDYYNLIWVNDYRAGWLGLRRGGLR